MLHGSNKPTSLSFPRRDCVTIAKNVMLCPPLAEVPQSDGGGKRTSKLQLFNITVHKNFHPLTPASGGQQAQASSVITTQSYKMVQEVRIKLFTGTLPLKRNGRQSNCLNPPKADEFCFGSEARGCRVVKRF